MIHAKDLAKEAPRSPKEILAGYAILARMIDKCRAVIAGTNNGYNFHCPVDQMLIDFKQFDPEEFYKKAEAGATDEELIAFVKENGVPRTDEEVAAWNERVIAKRYHGDPEKGAWFDGECARLGLDPEQTTLFEYLDYDDKVSYPAA